ncbi:MAG: hypothetical protein ACHQK8_00145 [Bacteroidia bacterium]
MEDSNLVLTLNDEGSMAFVRGPIKIENDTTLYKFNINELKRIRIVMVGDETYFSTSLMYLTIIGVVAPSVIFIGNTNASWGYQLLMAAGVGAVIGLLDAIIEDLIFPYKPRKIIGQRYKLEIHQIEPTKFYVQPVQK